MPYPETWLRGAIEKAAGCPAWPMAVPEAAPVPFVVYRRNSTIRERTLEYQTASPVASFQLMIVAESYLAAKDLGERLRLGIDNFNGSEGGVTIDHVYLTDESDVEVDYDEGTDKPTYTIQHIYEVRYCEKR
jgi:hypothetical protein